MRISSLLCKIMTLRKLFNTPLSKDLTGRSKNKRIPSFRADADVYSYHMDYNFIIYCLHEHASNGYENIDINKPIVNASSAR